ncbi:MAG: FG-GAP-like repeat-containing protein [Pyrinomonadaceae bacterium]
MNLHSLIKAKSHYSIHAIIFMILILVIAAGIQAQTLDVFNPNANVSVDDIEYLPDGKLLICGQFTTIGGQNRRAIARLNADGTLDTTFPTVDTAFQNILDAIIQPDGKILISGGFSTINGVARVRVARLNSDGTLDTGFDVGLTPPIGSARLALLPDGKVLVPANAGNGINRVLRRNSDGSADASFSSAIFNNTIGQVVAQADGKVIAVGGFTTVDGVSRMGIARLNANGTLDKSFNANSNNLVFLVTLAPDGKIYAGGSFTSIGGQTRTFFARLNSDGSADTAFQDAQIVGTGVRPSILLPDGKVLIAGSFDTVGGVARKQLARLNADGTLDTTFRNMQVGVDSLSAPNMIKRQPDGKILVAGNFTTVDGQARNRLGRITTNDVRAPFDFDGDGKTDLSIFRPSNGEWWYQKSSNGGNAAFQFGSSADKIVPADFTGDGKTDVAVFRPSTGEWFILRSEDFSYYSFPFGVSTDVPVPADFDGDGKADAAVFRPSDSTWYINKSSGGTDIIPFGASGDVPVAANYDGDTKADIAIYRPSANQWWIRRSSNASVFAVTFGAAGDKLVQGDYTGDGKADVAIWRPSTGEWFILRSEDFSYYSFPFGTGGDAPAPGDFDGDGRFDATVFRPSGSTWYVQRTTAGTLIQSFGTTGDTAVPNAFVR